MRRRVIIMLFVVAMGGIALFYSGKGARAWMDREDIICDFDKESLPSEYTPIGRGNISFGVMENGMMRWKQNPVQWKGTMYRIDQAFMQ